MATAGYLHALSLTGRSDADGLGGSLIHSAAVIREKQTDYYHLLLLFLLIISLPAHLLAHTHTHTHTAVMESASCFFSATEWSPASVIDPVWYKGRGERERERETERERGRSLVLSVCCINFSNVASEAGGTEEGPTAELASDAVHEAAACSVCPRCRRCLSARAF